jgi:hypothetical protein
MGNIAPFPARYEAVRQLFEEIQRHGSQEIDADAVGRRLQIAMESATTRRFIAAYLGRTLSGSVPDFTRWEPPSF